MASCVTPRYLISMLEPACGADVIRLCFTAGLAQSHRRRCQGTRCCRCSPPEQSRPASHRSCLRGFGGNAVGILGHRIESGIDAEPCPSPKHHSDLGPRRAASGTARVVTQQRISDGRAEGCGPSRAKCLAEPAARRMTDIDLLVVDPAHAVRPTKRSSISAYRMVRPTKWTPTPSITTDHQEPALLRDDRHGSVEIHSHLLPRFARHALTREAAVRGISAEAKGIPACDC